jgi:hypothetical protein
MIRIAITAAALDALIASVSKEKSPKSKREPNPEGNFDINIDENTAAQVEVEGAAPPRASPPYSRASRISANFSSDMPSRLA